MVIFVTAVRKIQRGGGGGGGGGGGLVHSSFVM